MLTSQTMTMATSRSQIMTISTLWLFLAATGAALNRLPGPVVNPLNPDGLSIAQEILAGAIPPQPDYTVQTGDTPEGLASRFGTSVQCLEGANPGIADGSLLCAGQSLNVPNSNATFGYAVCPGDTLASIARQFGVSLGALQQANSAYLGVGGSSLAVGQVVTVPNVCAPSTQSDLFPCGEAFYYLNSYSCFDSNTLCPEAQGIPTYPCGDACYASSSYTCYQPGNQLCPVSDGVPTFPCGAACYSPAKYSCDNGSLQQVPPGQTGVMTVSVSSNSCPPATGSGSTSGSVTTSITSTVPSSSVSGTAAPSGGSGGSGSPVGTSTGFGSDSSQPVSPSTPAGQTSLATSSTSGTPGSSFPGTTTFTTTVTTSSSVTVIEIGGSTFTIGSGESTITLNSETIVIGPSGVDVNSTPLSLPSTLTGPITTDGITLTVVPASGSPTGGGGSSSLGGASSTQSPVSPSTSAATPLSSASASLSLGSASSSTSSLSTPSTSGPSSSNSPLLSSSSSNPFSSGASSSNPSSSGGASSGASSSGVFSSGASSSGASSSNPSSGGASSGASSSGASSPNPSSSGSTSSGASSSGASSSGPSPSNPSSGSTFSSVSRSQSTPQSSTFTTITSTSAAPGGLPGNGGSSVTPIPGSGSNPATPTSTPTSSPTSSGAVLLQTGSFTTSTLSISGFSTYSSTTTTVNGHRTILPLWPCLFPPIPACAIIVIPEPPFVPEPPEADLPPPPCQPAISFDSAGNLVPIFGGFSEKRKRQIEGNPLCILRFTDHQTTTLSSAVGGTVQLFPSFFDQNQFPADFTFLPNIIQPESTTIVSQAPDATVGVSTSACAAGQATQSVRVTDQITLPKGANDIDISIPVADAAGSNWDVTLAHETGPDPNVGLLEWLARSGGGSGFVLAEGEAGNGSIAWTTPAGTSRSTLELQFQTQFEDMLFTLTLAGNVTCGAAPPPPPSAPPSLTGGFWLESEQGFDNNTPGLVVLVPDSQHSCDQFLDPGPDPFFLTVSDLNGNPIGGSSGSGEEAAILLSGIGNGVELSPAQVQSLCGVEKLIITIAAAGDGGLTFHDSQQTATSGTCTTVSGANPTSCTRTVTAPIVPGTSLFVASATLTDVWHCSATGNPGYCNAATGT